RSKRHPERRTSARRRPLDRQLGATGKRLEDHAVALRRLQKCVELVLTRVAVELEAQADRAEPHRRIAVDAKGASEVEIALGVHAIIISRRESRRSAPRSAMFGWSGIASSGASISDTNGPTLAAARSSAARSKS